MSRTNVLTRPTRVSDINLFDFTDDTQHKTKLNKSRLKRYRRVKYQEE